MTPDDRVAAIFWLAISVAFATIAIAFVEMLLDIYQQVPAVTKDPITGELYIPRSDLHVGARSRRHHGIAQPRPRSQSQR